jgi:hypothetical protein
VGPSRCAGRAPHRDEPLRIEAIRTTVNTRVAKEHAFEILKRVMNIGIIGQAHDALAGVVPYLDAAKWGLLAITLIDIGVMLWARID